MDKSRDDRFGMQVPVAADGLQAWSVETDIGLRCQCDQIDTAAYVPADHDFGGCLEFTKTGDTQFIIPRLPHALYAKQRIGVRFRLKAVSGPMPTVCIAARPALQHCETMLKSDPVLLDRHQIVATLFAVIGMGTDSAMPADRDIGLCLTGAIGGTLRVAEVDVFDIALAL